MSKSKSGKTHSHTTSALSRKSSSSRTRRRKVALGQRASAEGFELRSYNVGALPLVNTFLDRMQLTELLADYLPPDDPRTELPTVRALMVLVRNVLLSRQPVYGVAEWAAQFPPDLLELAEDEVAQLSDDRLGRSLQRLFLSSDAALTLAVVRHPLKSSK